MTRLYYMMSAPNTDKPAAGKVPGLDFYPPPPPGPPPSQQTRPQHSNETPIADSHIPAYDPARPHFAPPPESESGLYDIDPADTKPTESHAAAQAPKKGWGERLSALGSKAAAPVNMLANKVGSEAFLPATMEKEVEKATRILRGFCSKSQCQTTCASCCRADTYPAEDGIYSDVPVPTEGDEKGKQKTKPNNKAILTIPAKVISRAVGLAIFTTGRVGFHVSGSTGSGILIARLPDGSWSPPSGIQVHGLGAGFVMGIDIYDCVVVINTPEALAAFKSARMALGADLAITAGPWGAGGNVEVALPEGKEKPKDSNKKHEEQRPAEKPVENPELKPQGSKERKASPLRALTKPVYSYVKSRGLYAGVQVDGTVVTERREANEKFYGAKVTVEQVLKGAVPPGPWASSVVGLFDVIKGAEASRSQEQQPAANVAAAATHPAPVGSYAPTQGVGVHAGSAGGADVAAAGVQSMNISGAPPTQHTPLQSHPVQNVKAEEAAREAAAASPVTPGPPGYTTEANSSEAPPAYVDDGQTRPVDSKTGQH
jgi:SH3 domain-containing YSC84-like protein 1